VVRAILFDWGNTLAEWRFDPDLFAEAHAAGLLAIARPDAPLREPFTAAYVDRVPPLVLAPAEDEIDYVATVRDLLRELGSDVDDAAAWRFVVAEQRVWRPAHRLEASALALLDALADRDLSLGLVSNLFDPPALVRELLAAMGVLERLGAVALSAEVGKRKPHPALFEHALVQLGVDPADTVVVGDRLREDVGGAHALGMRAIQALWFAADDSEGPEPDAQAFTPSDVLRIVDRWSREG
jgi:FMN phosphatase YigB (HAD superfamily)